VLLAIAIGLFLLVFGCVQEKNIMDHGSLIQIKEATWSDVSTNSNETDLEVTYELIRPTIQVSFSNAQIIGKNKTDCNSIDKNSCGYEPVSRMSDCVENTCKVTFQVQKLDRNYCLQINVIDNGESFLVCKELPLKLNSGIPGCPYSCCISGYFENKNCENGFDCISNQCVLKDSQTPTNNEFLEQTSQSFWENKFCNKINPYNLEVRKAASEAIPAAHQGAYSYVQLIDIYSWVKKNIKYLNVPFDSYASYDPEEVIITKSGDCKNQAVLLASMIESIGGKANVIINQDCAHAYVEVHFGNLSEDALKRSILLNLWEETGRTQNLTPAQTQSYAADFNNALKNIKINYYTREDGVWAVFDPAGSYLVGSLHPACEGTTNYYRISSCLANPNGLD